MKHLMIVFSLLVLPMTAGCNFLQQLDKIPIDKQTQLITSITRTTTYFALKEAVPDDAKRVEVAKNIVLVVDNILSNTAIVSLNNELVTKVLRQYFTEDYALLLQNALDVLSLYYDTTIDVGQVVGPDNLARLQAFLKGVKMGAEISIPLSTGVTGQTNSAPLYIRNDS